MYHRLAPFLVAGILFPLTSTAQFFLNGNAQQLNDTCYQLTEAVNFQVGSIWNPNKIDLSNSFDVVLEVFLGCQDANGADGIVFGFQPVSTSIGMAGGGIGFVGVSPSIGIELDTWQNTDNNDPTFDHIAIIKNGDLRHQSANNLAGPVQASLVNLNVEDCDYHDLRVSWDANLHKLVVYFDCQPRLTYTGDIVQNIFNGDPHVYWGFTAATGGANNVHQVCFSYTTFLDQIEDVVMCPGGQVQLQARGGIRYEWYPPDGLSAADIPNPIASPDESTTYHINIYDACNQPFYDEVTVTVAGDSVFFDLGPDTLMCTGQTLLLDATTPHATYQWLDGATGPTYNVFSPGYYGVTVSRTDTFCIASDWVDVRYRPLLDVDLGPDTTLCLGQTLLLNAAFPDASYIWQDGATDSTYTIRSTGLYQVTLDHPCGKVADQVRVEVEDCRNVYFPNAFSPNDDGINDDFRCFQDGDVTLIQSFRIFDRWGGLVFQASDVQPDDIAARWNGEWHGKPALEGIYTYFATILFRDGTSSVFKGDIQLLR